MISLYENSLTADCLSVWLHVHRISPVDTEWVYNLKSPYRLISLRHNNNNGIDTPTTEYFAVVDIYLGGPCVQIGWSCYEKSIGMCSQVQSTGMVCGSIGRRSITAYCPHRERNEARKMTRKGVLGFIITLCGFDYLQTN